MWVGGTHSPGQRRVGLGQGQASPSRSLSSGWRGGRQRTTDMSV